MRELFRTSGGWAFNKYSLGFRGDRLDDWYERNFVLIIAGYLPIIFSCFALFFRKRDRKILFFFFLFLVGVFLSKGDLSPFGVLYTFALKKIPYFSIFREPYTKFTLIYLFSVATLFGYSVLYLSSFVPRMLIRKLYAVLITALFINAIPFFIGGFIPARSQSGPIKSYLVKVPGYLYSYLKDSLGDSAIYRSISMPDVYGGRSYNWESGISSGVPIIKFFSYGPVLSYNLEDSALGVNASIRNVYYSLRYSDLAFINYLRILNVDKLVQENSLDWRWVPNPGMRSPSSMEQLFSELVAKGYLTLDKEYGKYTDEVLKKVPNSIPNYFPEKVPLSDKEKDVYESLLAYELSDKPAMVSYKLNSNYVLPHIYIPEELDYVVNPAVAMPFSLTFADPKVSYAYYSQSVPGISYSSEYLAGERKFRKVKLDETSWHSGWAWPSASVSPNNYLEYKLVGTKEYFEVLSAKSYIDKADVNLWLGIKGIVEVNTFPLSEAKREEVLRNKFTSHLNAVFNIIEGLGVDKRDEEYWAMVTKVVKYLRRASKTYNWENNEKGKSVLMDTYSTFLKWVMENGYPSCGDYCYELDLENPGSYELLVGRQELDKIGNLDSLWYKSVSSGYLQVPTNKVDIDFNDGPTENGLWFKVGNVSLDKGKVLVNLSVGQDENILSTDWARASTYDVVSGGLNISTQELFSDEEHGGFAFFSRLKDWVGGQKYRVSFDYGNPKPGLKVAVVEDLPDYSLGGEATYKKVLFMRDVASPYNFGYRGCEGPSCYHFEADFESSSDARGAYLYILSSAGENFFSDLSIRNLSVRKIIDPPVLLVKRTEAPKDAGRLPDITFSKISATRYKVKVHNSGGPYDLVLSEAFDKGWALFYNSKGISPDVAYDDAKVSYLEGRVREVSAPNKAFDLDLGTLGMGEIAKDRHYYVNGYANSWLVKPEDVGNAQDYELVIEYTPQRYFILAILISGSTLFLSLLYLTFCFVKKYRYL